MSIVPKKIKIIGLPHGEAPEEVRKGWVGCVLPCEPECGHIPVYARGVVTGTYTKIDGFSVPQKDALLILESQDPSAAAWFKERGFPHEEECFRFQLAETEVAEHYTKEEEAALGPIHVYDDMETGSMRRMF